MRFLRLIMGIVILIQAIMSKDVMIGFFAMLFIAMPIFNIGCCSVGNCATTPSKKIATKDEEINFEEVA